MDKAARKERNIVAASNHSSRPESASQSSSAAGPMFDVSLPESLSQFLLGIASAVESRSSAAVARSMQSPLMWCKEELLMYDALPKLDGIDFELVGDDWQVLVHQRLRKQSPVG